VARFEYKLSTYVYHTIAISADQSGPHAPILLELAEASNAAWQRDLCLVKDEIIVSGKGLF
jgi:hypothetical protein